MKKVYLYAVIIVIALVVASIPIYIVLSKESQTSLTPLSVKYDNTKYFWRDNFSKTYSYDSSPTLTLGNITSHTNFGPSGNRDSTLSMTINGTSTYIQSLGNNDVMFVYISITGNLTHSLQPKSIVLDQNSNGSSNLTVSYVEFAWTALKTENVSVSNTIPSYTGYKNLVFSATLLNNTISKKNSNHYYFTWISVLQIWFTPPSKGQLYQFTFLSGITGLSDYVSSEINLEVAQWN
ncbi:hypothetical protein Thermo_00839 [Thermoplasmatales archaeon]|nr:hypothetical protein Thermo_00839 [Thermoplasmatales archaeon]